MRLSDFDYELPEAAIAQTPADPRDHSRLLVYDRSQRAASHHRFYELPAFLRAGDVLVVNESRVLPARLLGSKVNPDGRRGANVELLLLRRQSTREWETLVRPGRRLRPGARVTFGEGLLQAEIVAETPAGGRLVRFHYEGVFEELLDRLGQMPLPPYITERLEDPERYQTVYAKAAGSAAAPTAGLHFTPALLDQLREQGVQVVPVLLHVGLGTFRPVEAEVIEEHQMHAEYFELTPEAAAQINGRQGRLVAVGTTSVRVLESLADEGGQVRAGAGWTDIFIYPGYRWRAVEGLITNFHLPKSSLLMLVSSFAGREETLGLYRQALAEGYRFFSFGDAMLIL